MLRLLFICAITIFAIGCSSQYAVIMHQDSTHENHYVVIKNTGDNQQVFDCYSRPDSIWCPICKEIKIVEDTTQKAKQLDLF